MRSIVSVLVLATAALAGCGPTCQSTCRRVYSPSECGIVTPGVDDWTEMYGDCVNSCEDALSQTGVLGDYDPDERITNGTSVTLQNERQAAAWMDCVAETDCERLNDGYCEPI